jgi:hypothetical protein
MLTDDEGIRNGAIWGLYFIASAVFLICVPVINAIFSSETSWISFIVKFFALNLDIFLLFLTAIFHMRGYVYLGSKLDSNIVRKSAWAILIILIFFGLSILASDFAGSFNFSEYGANAFIGLFLIMLVIAEIPFAVGVVKLYKQLGILAIFAACIGLWAILVWLPWLTILLFIPSTLFLFKAANF